MNQPPRIVGPRWSGLTPSRIVRRAASASPNGSRSSRSAGSGPQLPALDSSLARRPRRAFTLVELLVAAGITALIAGFIAVIVRNVSVTWTRAGDRLGTDAQARLLLDQLQLDLQGALYRDDGNVWLAADVITSPNGNPGTPWQPAPRNPKPTNALSLDMTATRVDLAPTDRGKFEQTRYGNAGVWLRFFTGNRPVLGSTGAVTVPSAPVAVGYQIVRRFTATNPGNNNTAYLLHRVEVRPATASGRIGVLEAGYNIASANYTTGSSTSNNGAQTGDPRTIQAVTTNARNLDSVIADNVIDFGIRAYVRDAAQPGGLRLIFPATAAGAPSNSGTARLRSTLPSTTPPSQWGAAQPFPDVIDVMVRILTDEGAALIAGMEKVQAPALLVPQKYNSNAQQWWWGVATENSRVYTRRIVIQAKPL